MGCPCVVPSQGSSSDLATSFYRNSWLYSGLICLKVKAQNRFFCFFFFLRQMYQKDTWTCHGWQDRSRIRLQGIVRHLNQTSSSSHSLRGHLSVSLHRLTTLGLLSPGPTLLRDQQEGSNTQEGAADWPERFRHPSVDLIHSDPCPGTCLQVMNSR